MAAKVPATARLVMRSAKPTARSFSDWEKKRQEKKRKEKRQKKQQRSHKKQFLMWDEPILTAAPGSDAAQILPVSTGDYQEVDPEADPHFYYPEADDPYAEHVDDFHTKHNRTLYPDEYEDYLQYKADNNKFWDEILGTNDDYDDY